MRQLQDKRYLEATGFSMWPFLKQEDRIIVENIPVGKLSPGDVILYNAGGKTVCHRLVAKRKSADKYLLFTRGDYAPSWKTEMVSQEQFAGRVCGIVRLAKKGNNTRIFTLKGGWQTMGGIMIIAAFPLVIMIFLFVRKMLKK